MKHMAWVWFSSLFVGVYTAFVAMFMWNWFAVRALNLTSVSFLEMVGLIWLITILIDRPETDEGKWKIVSTTLELCVPDQKREILTEILQEQKDSMWVDALTMVFSRVVGNTTVLVLGFGLHILIG